MNIKQSLDQKMSIAVQFHQKGELEKAEQLYMNALSEYPNHPDILNLLGVSCGQQGKTDKAINYLKMAIIFNPNNPQYYCNLGEVLHRADILPEATENLTKAVNIAPNFAMAHYNLANVLKKLKREQKAINHYQQAINLMPNNIEVYYNLGNTYRDLGMYRSAIDTYEKAIKINYNHPNIHNNLAATLNEWDETEKALFHYQEAVKLDSNFKDAYINLSAIYQKLGETDKAIQCIEKVEYINSLNNDNTKKDLFALTKSSIFPIIFQSNDQIDKYRNNLLKTINNIDISNLSIDDLKKGECYPPSIITYSDRNNLPIKEKYNQLLSDKFKALPKRSFNTKPHIGFVVTHGHEGVFIKCMAGIINNISKTDFKITIVCSEPNGEKILSNALKTKEVEYLGISHDLKHAADTIYKHNIDILHYWEVGTDFINYFLPYLKPANIQCTSWGWPDTSGIENIDYYISCEAFENSESDNQYSEKLIQLKNLPVYYYKPPIPEIIKSRSEFNLKETDNIYLCAQNLRKVHPDFDQIVEGIIKLDNNSKVLFIEDKQKNISELLKQRILSKYPEIKDKIVFMPRMDESDYLSLVKNSDVILDTLYYTGGANTNYDAFAAGIPVVTMPTEFHRGRYTTGVYQKLNIYECIAKSKDEYIDIAVKIVTDKEFRNNISEQIINKSDKLFQDKQAVLELELCFINMIEDNNRLSL